MNDIPFIDLAAQQRRIRDRVDEALGRVLDHGSYIMGPEVAEVERRLGDFSGAPHVVTAASGTDALLMPLMAWGIGPGDAIFVPSFTFTASAEVVAILGATPVFVDVRPDAFTMDAASLLEAVAAVERQGSLRPAVIMPVDLFGLPADYKALGEVASRWSMRVLADAAQSFGAARDGVRVGTLGDATATSFFPAKPLGCYGDGGAVLARDEETAAVLRSIRVHGQGTHKYDTVRVGINGRLDTMQAAVLLVKLEIFAEELAARERVATRYTQALDGLVTTPTVDAGASSAWAQYTILVEERDRFAAALRQAGVPTAVYYPKPLHRQAAYASCPTAPGGLPVSEGLADRVLSLPMHPYLDEPTQGRVIAAVRDIVALRRN